MKKAEKTSLKIEYKQPSIGWCSVYLMANIFKNDTLLDYLKDDRFKGCDDIHINEMLERVQPELKISNVLYANQIYPKLPVGYIWECLTKDDASDQEVEIPVIPYLMTVRLIKEIYHHVAVLNISGELYYLDPYKEYYIKLDSPKHLADQFIDCCQVQRFYLHETDQWAILRGEFMGYDLFKKQTA